MKHEARCQRAGLIVSFAESGAKAGSLAVSYVMMAHKLHTRITALLPPACAVRLTKVTIETTSVGLQITATAPTAACPCCALSSSSIHSRYQLHLTDLPWGTCMVRLQLRVRTFVCQNPRCERRIFTERLPELMATYARKTQRLMTVLRALGVALGGNAGARLAVRLRLPTSPTTVLRLVRTASVPYPPALQAVGVDAWAWRRGHHDGGLCRLPTTAPGMGRVCPTLTGVLPGAAVRPHSDRVRRSAARPPRCYPAGRCGVPRQHRIDH
jgi:hypothetical protein